MEPCEIAGCDEFTEYIDEQDNKLCKSCMDREIEETDETLPEHFELISDVEKAIKEGNNVATSEHYSSEEMALREKQLSIIPSNETDLTVFVEDMTPEKLEIIKTEIALLPAVVDNKTYLKTFDMHQVVKSIRRLTKKSVVAKIKEWKTEFENKKIILNSDHEKMLKVLGPMEADLDEKRKWWDKLLDAYKMNAAHDEAKAQQQEWFRIHLIGLHTSALIDNNQFDIDKTQQLEAAELEAANDVLEAERVKLEREKFEFECVKNRLNFNEAWEDWQEKNKNALSQDEFDAEIKKIDPGFNTEENCHYNGFEPEKKPVKEYGPGNNGECISNEISRDLDQDNKPIPYIDSDQHRIDNIKTFSEDFIGELKAYQALFSDPKKQQKLKNFITSTEINFNIFKKAVE